MNEETRRWGDAETQATAGDARDLSASEDQSRPVAASARRRVLRWLVLFCRFGLVALWLFAAGAKIYTATDFKTNVANLVGERWAWDTTILIILCELLAALLLLLPRAVRAGALRSALLLLSFAAFALFYVYVMEGEPLECGCFGGLIASQLGVTTALRNLALLVPVAVVYFGHRRTRLP